MPPSQTTEQTQSSGTPRLLEQIAQQIRKVSLGSPVGGTEEDQLTDAPYCQSILFVEPIAWMQHIANNTQGRLNCPKCEQKLGNYSWINGKIKENNIHFYTSKEKYVAFF